MGARLSAMGAFLFLETKPAFEYIFYMLKFRQNDTSAAIVLTLNEMVTIPGPYYLFVFTQITTKDIVAFVLAPSDDISLYGWRYNEFIINQSILFSGKQASEWNYVVYQQASSTNTDVTLTSGILEYGKLRLDRPVDFAFTNYDTPTVFQTYNG